MAGLFESGGDLWDFSMHAGSLHRKLRGLLTVERSKLGVLDKGERHFASA
jgi:hypothetical protein